MKNNNDENYFNNKVNNNNVFDCFTRLEEIIYETNRKHDHQKNINSNHINTKNNSNNKNSDRNKDRSNYNLIYNKLDQIIQNYFKIFNKRQKNNDIKCDNNTANINDQENIDKIINDIKDEIKDDIKDEKIYENIDGNKNSQNDNTEIIDSLKNEIRELRQYKKTLNKSYYQTISHIKNGIKTIKNVNKNHYWLNKLDLKKIVISGICSLSIIYGVYGLSSSKNKNYNTDNNNPPITYTANAHISDINSINKKKDNPNRENYKEKKEMIHSENKSTDNYITNKNNDNSESKNNKSKIDGSKNYANKNNEINNQKSINLSNDNLTNQNYYYFPVRGDCLTKISKKITGTYDNWVIIYNHNNLKSDIIEVNQLLSIPRDLINSEGYRNDKDEDTNKYNNNQNINDKNNDNDKNDNDNYKTLFKGEVNNLKYYQADKYDTLDTISEKIFGSNQYSQAIFDFNRKLNPRFSSIIYNKEFVYIPEKILIAGK